MSLPHHAGVHVRYVCCVGGGARTLADNRVMHLHQNHQYFHPELIYQEHVPNFGDTPCTLAAAKNYPWWLVMIRGPWPSGNWVWLACSMPAAQRRTVCAPKYRPEPATKRACASSILKYVYIYPPRHGRMPRRSDLGAHLGAPRGCARRNRSPRRPFCTAQVRIAVRARFDA